MSVENPNCSVCYKFVRSGIFCNICNTWVHPKCNQLNYKDFKLFQKTNPDESWTCIKCNSEIFPFNNKSYSNFVPSQNNNIDNLKSFFNELNSLDNTLSSTDEDFPVVNCKYYETEEFKNLFSKTKSFSAFHLNISSLSKHFDELNTLLSLLEIKFSVIGITETKFSKNISPSINFSLPNYSVEHTPAESSAGGALLYIADYLSYKLRKDLTNNLYKSKELESIFIEIMYKKKKNVLIGCIYRHPCMSIEEFNDEYMLPLLEKASKENKPLILLGDFNINLLKSDTDNSVSNFLDILGSFSLLPQIILPTRITNTSKTLIDNIFVDSTTFQISSGNLVHHISDPLPQFSIFKNLNTNLNPKHNKYNRNWSQFDQENFVLDFFEID